MKASQQKARPPTPRGVDRWVMSTAAASGRQCDLRPQLHGFVFRRRPFSFNNLTALILHFCLWHGFRSLGSRNVGSSLLGYANARPRSLRFGPSRAPLGSTRAGVTPRGRGLWDGFLAVRETLAKDRSRAFNNIVALTFIFTCGAAIFVPRPHTAGAHLAGLLRPSRHLETRTPGRRTCRSLLGMVK